MKILFAASECAPFAKVGGLADVVASLPKALKKNKVNVSVIIPFYKPIKIKEKILVKKNIALLFNKDKKFFNLYKAFLNKSKTPLYLVENKEYVSSNGIYPEESASSEGKNKEAERFLFFSLAVLEAAKLLKTDIIHCHDWHTGIIPYLVKKNKLSFKTIITVHNIGYQGVFQKEIVNKLLGENFQEKVNCLSLGIQKADMATTVSPNYSKEVLSPQFGFGLEKELKKRKKDFQGIVNGLDYNEFNPKTDTFIKENYSPSSFALREKNKEFLIKKCFKGEKTDKPVLGIISRLADQKGFDLIQKILPHLMKTNFQFILLGKGTEKYEALFQKTAKDYPHLFFAKIGFDEKLARQIYAGTDIFLMPSYYEPCGLGQIIALKYGSVPVARSTGGIKDTIKNVKIKKGRAEGTGFLFQKYLAQDFLETIEKATKAYQNKKAWKEIQLNGMSADFSWQKSAEQYLKVYQKLIK